MSNMDDKGTGPGQTASVEQRVAAIEAVFEARGMEPKPFIDTMTHSAEEEWVPRNGARVVAKAWTDPEYRRRLLAEHSFAGDLRQHPDRQRGLGRALVLRSLEVLRERGMTGFCRLAFISILCIPPRSTIRSIRLLQTAPSARTN
jgi:hypothetical protein